MRTSPQKLEREASEALIAAFAESGLHAIAARSNPGYDLVLEAPSGPIPIEIRATSVVTADRIRALLDASRRAEQRKRIADNVVVVADELPAEARELLRSAGWGYLDRRGRFWFRADNVIINDTDLPAMTRNRRILPSVDPLSGRVALSMGVWILMHPQESHGVRGLSRAIGSAPSTAQSAFARLRDEALIKGDGRPLVPELFWAVTNAWKPERHYATREPSPNDDVELLGLGSDLRGWAMSGDVAAAAWGAPIPIRLGATPSFYVPSPSLNRALQQLDTSSEPEAGAVLSVAPSDTLIENPYDVSSAATPWLTGPWPTRLSSPSILLRTDHEGERSSTTGIRLRSSFVSGDTVFLLDGPEGQIGRLVEATAVVAKHAGVPVAPMSPRLGGGSWHMGTPFGLPF